MAITFLVRGVEAAFLATVKSVRRKISAGEYDAGQFRMRSMRLLPKLTIGWAIKSLFDSK